MLFGKKIKFRYQNFRNKYIKTQIGKGDNNVPHEKQSDATFQNELDDEFDVLENEDLYYKFKLIDQDNIFYKLKLLSELEGNMIPYTQFPPRMIFCEDIIHNVGAIGANVLKNLPEFIKLKEKGENQSLDAIIKIENENYNSIYNDRDFETIQKLNYISDHDGIVLKLNKKENTSNSASNTSNNINIISFNLEGLCRKNYKNKETNKIIFDPIFAQRLELLDIHFDINLYLKDNAFDILNINDQKKTNDFIDLIFKNVYIPPENIESDNSEDEIFLVD